MPSVTVIIPTLELATPITDRLVRAIQASSAVARIMFINNVRQDSYSSRYADHGKVEVVTHMPNLMVNPAWNYGMSLCDTKYYLLLNDDLVMSGQIIDGITKILDARDDLNLFTVRTVVDYDLTSLHRAKHAGNRPCGDRRPRPRVSPAAADLGRSLPRKPFCPCHACRSTGMRKCRRHLSKIKSL